MKRLALGLLVAVALASPAAAQTTQTKRFVYEWLHLRTFSYIGGWLFIGDVQGHHSHLQGFLKDPETGETSFDCSGEFDGMIQFDAESGASGAVRAASER